MKTRYFFIVAVFASLVTGCTAGTSSVLIQLVADAPLDAKATDFRIVATQGAKKAESTLTISGDGVEVATSQTMPSSFALRIESAIRGDVTLEVTALSSKINMELGKGTGLVQGLSPGKTAKTVLITLIKGTHPLSPDGGTNDGGEASDLAGADLTGLDLPAVDMTASDLPECVFDDDMSTFDNCVFAQ